MPRPDTPILNRLAEVNDGRSAITGEHSGQGFLGSKRREAPVVNRRPVQSKYPRLPEKDTDTMYAFKTGVASYRLVPKSAVDGK